MLRHYKILSGKYDATVSNLFPLVQDRFTRGHQYKIYKRRARLHLRKNSFTYRVVDTWNNLPANIVSAPNISTFERRLDNFWTNLPIRYNFKDTSMMDIPPEIPDDEEGELVL